MKVIKSFFSKDYRKYGASQLDFRKNMLKTIQILGSILSIVFVISAFPFQVYPKIYYITIPVLLVLVNAIGLLVQRKRFEKYCETYLLILLILGQAISIELTWELAIEYENKANNKFKVYFCGFNVGVLQIISFLNFSSSFHKCIISLALFVQIIIKDVQFGKENIHIRAGSLVLILIFINFIFMKTEILFYQMWTSLVRRNESLLHFQKLIENFPSEILVLNLGSIKEDRPLYCNKEAEFSLQVVENPNKSLTKFLESFRVCNEQENFEKDTGGNNETRGKKTEEENNILKDLIIYNLRNQHSNDQDYVSLICETESHDKWKVKFGWIEWGQYDALIIIFYDISKTEKIKELQILDKNKNRILATVSHELRTPINGTLGMIENAQGLLNENQHDIKYCLDIAKSSTKTLLYMVNDILDIEQIRHGKLRLHFEKVDIHELIHKVLPLIEVQIKHKNLELIYENECPKGTQVLADASRLQQILWNLLWNACKFTSNGYVKIGVKFKQTSIKEINLDSNFKSTTHTKECHELDLFLKSQFSESDESNIIEISVKDTGIGMDAQTIDHLFQDFGKKENSSNPTGVGLGLAISQSLVKQMNSTGIIVQSEYGKGSNFHFTLNAASFEDERLIPSELPSININHLLAKTEASHRSKSKYDKAFKLLLVDDDLVNHCVFDLYLKDFAQEHSITKSFNGQEALKIILDKAGIGETFDLILMDCNMPVMDGFQAAKEIKNLIGKGKIPNVKVIALTANSLASEKEHCLEVGMIEVWCKPISKVDFLKNIRRLVNENMQSI